MYIYVYMCKHIYIYIYETYIASDFIPVSNINLHWTKISSFNFLRFF